MLDPRYDITTMDELRALVPPPRAAQQTKVLAALDGHCRRWIERSPFVVVSSVAPGGGVDVSPKGDPPGFVRVLDDTTVAVPDRPGNRRLDTFSNVIHRPNVGVMFVVPGRGEVLRAKGRARISTDPALLATMVVADRPPTMALVVDLDEVMFHCGKSVIRSGLWSSEAWPPIDDLASYAQCLADQTRSDETVEEMESRFATWHQGNELY